MVSQAAVALCDLGARAFDRLRDAHSRALGGRRCPAVTSAKVLEEQSALNTDKILAKHWPELLDRPVTRQDYENALHPITFSAPVIGSGVASPVRIASTANVPDGTVTAVLLDAAGSVIAERVASVACGAGCRGDYAIEIPFEVSERQSGVIQVRYEGRMEVRYEGPPCSTSPWCWTHEIPVTLLP